MSLFRSVSNHQIISGIRTRFQHLIKTSKWFFTPIALTFLLVAIWQSRFVIGTTLERSVPIYLMLSVLVWMAAHLLSPLFVRVALKACGAYVNYNQVLDLHLRYLPARYIPGGIWHTVARVSGLHRLGIHPRQLSSFVLLENLVALSVAFFIGGMLVGFSEKSESTFWQPIAFTATAISLFMLVSFPLLINRLVLKAVGSISCRDYLTIVFISIIFWLFASTSFYLFIFALPNIVFIPSWIDVIGAYLFSWGVGFLAIFAPQGVGVFEVVAANLMPTTLPFHTVIALLAGFRLVVITADVLMWAGWTTQRRLKT